MIQAIGNAAFIAHKMNMVIVVMAGCAVVFA
jgi:hypothetical protein